MTDVKAKSSVPGPTRVEPPPYELLVAVEALRRLTKAAEMARRNLQGTTPCYCDSSPHEGYCGDLLNAVGRARAILDDMEAGDPLARYNKAASCTHANGCICIEPDHRDCCGSLREEVLASMAAPGAVGEREELDVERLTAAMNDAQIDPSELRLGKHLRPVAERIAAEYARLSVNEGGVAHFSPDDDRDGGHSER